MIEPTFHTEDDYGIGCGGNMPYFAIKLTKEQIAAVKNKTAGIYEIDGKQLFEIRKDQHTPTG